MNIPLPGAAYRHSLFTPAISSLSALIGMRSDAGLVSSGLVHTGLAQTRAPESDSSAPDKYVATAAIKPIVIPYCLMFSSGFSSWDCEKATSSV
jgi:hypothetical protein